MTRKGVWDLQEVRDKYLASLWDNPTDFEVVYPLHPVSPIHPFVSQPLINPP